MKARNPQTGNLETVYVKALDSMPVGTEVDFDGTSANIPTGWEEVNNVLYENNSGAGKTADITLNDDVDNYEWFIFYGFDDDNSSVKMTIPFYKEGTGNLKGNYYNISSSSGAWTTRNYTYSGATLTYSNQYYYTLAQGSVFSYPNFRVTKIVGYK